MVEGEDSRDIAGLTRGMTRLDDKSYRKFFQLYYRRLWAYLFVIANGNGRDIEDALQLAFARVIRGIKIFHTEKEFWAWLAVVTRNAWYDNQRKERRFNRVLEIFRSENSGPVRVENPELEQDGRRLDEALVKLEEEERHLINRKYMEGCSYRDLATEFNVTEKAIESRLARIRGKLRMILVEEN